MEGKDQAVALIVSAIISKSEVGIGADIKNGINIFIRAADEMVPNYQGRISLNNLVSLVRDSL